MSAHWEGKDLFTGSVVVASLVLALIGVLRDAPYPREHLTPLYTEFSELGGVAAHTPVLLNGFRVGRVESVSPRTDSSGRLTFRVRMLVKWQFGKQGPQPYQVGLRARLIPPPANVIGAAILNLETPMSPGIVLAAGATIPGVRDSTAIDATRSRMDSLTAEIRRTLRDARGLMVAMRQASRNQARWFRRNTPHT